MIALIGRILLRTFLAIIGFLIVLLLVFDRMVQFRMDDKDTLNWFHARHVDAHVNYYTAEGRKIRYIQTDDSSRYTRTGGGGQAVDSSRVVDSSQGVDSSKKATILFIHGAPSSSSYWRIYLSDSILLTRATMYAPDRPGYGYSGLGKPLPDIAAQAHALKIILDSLHQTHHPIVVVGVSYGGPIAARLTMDYPELVDGLILLAPPIGPGREKVFWFTYLIENPLLNWVIPRMLQSANTEKVHHKDELTKMLPLWQNIHVPVTYMQGEKDELVDTSNASFAKDQLKNVPSLDVQMIPGRGHLIAFDEKEKIEKAILDMLDKVGTRH